MASRGPTQQEVAAKYQQLENQRRQLMAKMSELEGEQHEHGLVVDCLSKVDSNRKCFRMIGGVLVERTVKEVLPAVSQNKNQIGQVLTVLTKQFESKSKEVEDFKSKYGIQSQGQQQQQQQQQNQSDDAKSAGVLV